MAKKKSNSLKFLPLIPVALAVLALVMMLFKAVSFKGSVTNVESSFTGFQVAFGFTKTTETIIGTVKQEILSFSILGLLAVILPLAGAVVQLFAGKIGKFVGLILALAGTVLLFIMPSLVVFSTEALATVYSALTAGLAIGAILAGVFAALETLVIGYELLKK